MAVIDGYVVILVFVLIVCVAIISSWLITPGSYDETRWKVFLTTIAALGIAMVFVINYSQIDIQNQQKELLKIREHDNIDREVNEILKLLEDGVEKSPSLVKELMPIEYPEKENDCSNRSLKERAYQSMISKRIFYLWQLLVAEKQFVEDEDGAFMALFLQWASSKQLQNLWKKSYITLAPEGKKFGEILFKYSGKVKETTVEEFRRVTCEMRLSTEYLTLFK